jgi:PE-PPE domain
MSGRKLRWLGLGLVATAGAGVLGLSAMMNPTVAYADGEDIGLAIGGSGLPIPGPEYVEAANELYLDNGPGGVPNYPDLTFFQATPSNPFGNGLFTPEGLYPLTGVHTLLLNYPTASDGFPALSSSVGQGMAILESTIAANAGAGDTSTVFGYSQSSTIASYVMQQLDPNSNPEPDSGLNFLLIGDPSAPNGGLLERFAGFQTLADQGTANSTSLPLSLPSLGINFDSTTPADDYVTSIYTLEYDGYADFPQYPINFLSDLNAFLGIEEIHGTYLNDVLGTSGPTPEQIANAILLPGSMDSTTDPCAECLTNYYMIPTETAPLVSLLPTPLQELLGPDLTVLINLGYGSLTQGWSTGPADVATPFGLWPTDISASDLLTALENGAEQGFQDLMSGTDPYSSSLDPASSGQSFTDLLSALSADAANPAASLTDFINAISSAASTAYSTLLPLTDIANALVTSVPAYELSLFTTNLSTGDLLDALGLPIAADTALNTLAAGFALEVIEDAISSIQADFSGLF